MSERKHEYMLWPNSRICFDPETQRVTVYHPEQCPEEIVISEFKGSRSDFTKVIWPFSTQIA